MCKFQGLELCLCVACIVTTASACKSQSLWSPNALPKLMAMVICHDILKLKCLCPSVKKDCYKCLNGATTRTNVTQRQLSSGHTRHKTLSELMRRQRRTRARLSVVFLIWIVSNQTATETATASHFDWEHLLSDMRDFQNFGTFIGLRCTLFTRAYHPW